MSMRQTTERLPRIAVIVGSNRPGRTGPAVAEWFMEEAGRHGGVDARLLDLADLALPGRLAEPAPGAEAEAMAALSGCLTEADGFVVVTPEYNHSFPAALKHVLDFTGPEWHAKPVAFVSYGGVSGGLRAVEQLRQIFPELHATTVRDTVSFHGVHTCLDDRGAVSADAEKSAAAKRLLDGLTWWARALRTARDRHPYSV